MTSFPQLTPEQEDKLFAMKIEWQRQKDYRDRKWGGDPEKFDAGLGSYLTIGEEFSQ